MIWYNCYDLGWQGEILPESFSHPAKFSRALIRRIYEHAFAEGWLAPGMTVLDPFGGVALGALDAMWHRLNWVGVELKPKFVALGQQNLDLWRRKYGSKEGFGSARIIQGDSRKLTEVIGGADLVCSSPPYAESIIKDQRGSVIKGGTLRKGEVQELTEGYGSSPGQLGAMKEGDFDCVVGSPPFSPIGNQPTGRGQGVRSDYRAGKMKEAEPDSSYGHTEGQLASLPEGRIEAVIGSPPYECARTDGEFQRQAANRSVSLNMPESAKGYGDSALGRDRSEAAQDTFWQASREILLQCHTILKPGGHAIWVTKRFVRAGKIVEFSGQWQALCESVGFRAICRHKAMLVKNHGEQETIFNGTEQIRTERKSFFRRLAEKKGSPALDWEDVMCLETPQTTQDAPETTISD